ncbi:tagatose 6-phosphate kinase [Paenibacillus sp. UNCCL117]|uniref:1-phosphofructokinase n=1 Tax=unclassified Paenibacillus TaxID=185978 RepID=UPI00087F3F53|nr:MULTISPECIES: 1-phosphofructokinase [unclassified Paenibacillus]SDC68019.1 tagatose 6-phosphate kinase [Paenibacillus sp. cl123]SFW23488.1 tagatose 6-phosphate kinase [Paenibacillus sp. UNCCL117]
MIVTVTLNAAIDKTYYVNHLEKGRVTRADRVLAEPGGKGINVARVIAQLGRPVLATGFAGGSNGEFIRRGLDKQGIRHDFVPVNGESRLCLNMMEADGSSTELLEPGPVISDEEMSAFRAKLLKLAEEANLFVFSGSLPAGVPKSFYAELLTDIHQAGAKALLDTSGEALIRGIEAGPYAIKPNEEELAAIEGRSFETEAAILEAMRGLGNRTACIQVSRGSEGSLALYEGLAYRVKPPVIEAVNTVGCGDAYMAGTAIGLHEGLPYADILRLATAAAAANALNDRAGHVDAGVVEALREQVQIEVIG